MLTNLVKGLNLLANFQGATYLVVGSVIGVVLGVIPGLGGIVLLTIVLAFVSHISLVGAICLFLATQAASYFSASITSILLNTPAHPEAFAVTFDGFPMASRGEAGRALGLSAASTCAGGLIGCVIFVLLIPTVDKLPLIFHPPELALLVIIAMLLVATLGAESVSKALISVAVGLMIASIGASPITGVYIYTFNAVSLTAGISLVALALGSFAIPQMVLVFGTATTVARQDMLGREVSATKGISLQAGFRSQVIQGVIETFRHWVLVIQSAVIGVLTGVIPGIGGFAANFLSYGVAQQTSKKRKEFGTGLAEGIIAPEGSSLAKEAGGLLPIIGLGIPGGVGGALFIAALAVKGVKVGYGFSTQYPTLPYEMIWVVAFGGIIGTGIGVLSASTLAKVTRVPGPTLVPFMMVLAVVGAFVADISFFSVMEMLVLSVVGFVLRRLRYSLASFALALVLSPYLAQDVDLTGTVFPHFIWLRRPLTDVLLVIAIVILISKTVQMRRQVLVNRERIEAKVFGAASVEGRPADDAVTAAQAKEIAWMLEAERNPYPLLALIAAVFVVGVAVPFVVYALANFNLGTGLEPEIAGSLAAAAGFWRVVIDGRGYLRYLAYKRSSAELGSLALLTTSAGTVPSTLAETHVPLEDGVDEIVVSAVPVRYPAIKEKAWGTRGQFGREVFAFCWLGALVAASYVFGFVVAVPLFCVVYGLTSTGRVFSSMLSRVIFAVGSAAVMWGLTYGMMDALHLTFTPVFPF